MTMDDLNTGTDDSKDQKDQVTENEDGSVTVALAAPPTDLPEESINLLPTLTGNDKGKKFVKELAEKILDNFKEDWDSSESWRKKRRDRWKLLFGALDEKQYPFKDCANVHIPVMLERVLRLVHRMFAEIFPDRDVVFTALPSTSLSQERADIVTLHDNWQIKKEIPDFFKQNRRAMMEFVANGDCIFHSSRDIPAKRNRHEAMSCEEVVFPYFWRTSLPDMSDVPRKTRVLRKFKHELIELQDAGIYTGIDEMLDKEKEPGFEEGPDLTIRPVIDKFEGKEAPQKSKAAPWTLYEYHGWCKLPGQNKERPIVATVSPRTKEMVGLYLREQEDWKDRARFEKQMGELSDFQQAQQMATQAMMMEQQVMQRLAQPDVPPEEPGLIQQHLQMTAPPPPVPPKWLKPEQQQLPPQAQRPDPVRMVPIEYFSHGTCIENLEGSLGFGIGLLLEEFNKAANTAGSQFTDSATLANVMTLIMPDNVTMEPGDTRLSPGEIHRVRGVSAEQINNAFKVLQFPQANPQLMDLIKLMLESADGVSSAPDVLSGEAGKANETYRGIATRVEQATKQLTVLAQNYLEVLTQVLRNNARLNAVFMNDEEIKSVVDPRTLETQQIKVDRSLYLEDYEMLFSADTRFGGREQKIAEADQLVGMFMSMPPEVATTIFPPSFVYEAVVRGLKARGMHDMIRYLGPRPPSPQEQAAMGMQPPMPGMPPPQAGPGGPPPPQGAPPRPPPRQGPPPGPGGGTPGPGGRPAGPTVPPQPGASA